MIKGVFGTIYTQFENQPVKAIKHLVKVKEGEAVKAIHHPKIGFIDFVWGENDKNNIGYGLKHIIEKHGNDIKRLGYAIEIFIPMIILYGELKLHHREKDKIILDGKTFRVVIKTEWDGKRKIFLLTAFDIKAKK